MKIFNCNIFFALALSALTLSSCSSDDDYTVASQTNADSLNVSVENVSKLVMASTENTKTVTLHRNKTNGALTVPVTLSSGNGYDVNGKAIFTAPSEVTFADGQADAQFVITASDSIEMFKEYDLHLSVSEQYTIQYMKDQGMPRADFVVVKEDFSEFAKGKYASYFRAEEGKEPDPEAAVLEYSKASDTYRIANVVNGQTITFKVDAKNLVKEKYPSIKFVNANFVAGTDPSYGVIKGSPSEDKEYTSYYDTDTKTYYFGFVYNVSAGSFGSYYEKFVVE